MWNYPPAQVLAPVDFGEASVRALAIAGLIAEAYRARLEALHAEALEAPPYYSPEQVESLDQQRFAARAAAQAFLAHFTDGLVGVSTTSIIIDGPPVDAILAAARHADLLVMGTHGRRGPRRWWLGSVAERVVREAPAPVLVVRAGGASDRAVFARIAVAAIEPGEGAAARYARGLAERFTGRLVAQTTGHPAETASREEATLVVVARRSEPWLGEHTERLVRSCHLPILFVPQEGG